MKLTGKQRRFLRAQAHHLSAVVMVGQKGVTPDVVAHLDGELTIHELLKVKVLSEAPESAKESAAALATATGATVAQVIGRTAVLYRESPDDKRIVLPRPTAGTS